MSKNKISPGRLVLAVIIAVVTIGAAQSQLNKSAAHPAEDRQALFIAYKGLHQLVARGLLPADCAKRQAVSRKGLRSTTPGAKPVCLDEPFAESMGLFQNSDMVSGN